MHNYLLITISGTDRPGIVRDAAAAMTNLDINIEESSMTALRGAFTIMMIVRLPESLAISTIKAALAELEQRTGVITQSQLLDDEQVMPTTNEPNCIVTVSGGDRPGIVHAVTEIIAEEQGSIVDLSTSVVERGGDNLYIMALEIQIADIATLQDRLQQVGKPLQIDIDIMEMEESIA
ncbi:MAG: ACT domain-containing protein [Mariprofundales bacterium]|nr:ACT domain-containing protein [Mariprofundales bacterium]